MRTLQLYGTGSATANAVATVTVPSKALIKAVQVSVRINCITDGGQVDLEISRASARQIAVNGALDPILRLSLESNFVTSGLAQAGINQTFGLNADFAQGAIIYLHALIGGTIVYDANFIFRY